MKITAGTQVIENAKLYSEKVWEQGAARPTLRVVLEGGITDAQIEALKSGDWTVAEDIEIDNESEAHVWSGYNTLVKHEIVFAHVATVEQAEAERDAAKAEAEKAQAEKEAAEAEKQKVKDTVKDVIQQISDDNTAINTALPLIEEWVQGAYKEGDIRAFNGAAYKCVQDHDSTEHPEWDCTVATMWVQYHGTTVETARNWAAPTGPHDTYKEGEYMVYTDGKTYKCLAETMYSPVDAGTSWEEVTA